MRFCGSVHAALSHRRGTVAFRALRSLILLSCIPEMLHHFSHPHWGSQLQKSTGLGVCLCWALVVWLFETHLPAETENTAGGGRKLPGHSAKAIGVRAKNRKEWRQMTSFESFEGASSTHTHFTGMHQCIPISLKGVLSFLELSCRWNL